MAEAMRIEPARCAGATERTRAMARAACMCADWPHAARVTDAISPLPVPVTVSFVVPAHDEARLIGATLDALHAAAQAIRLHYEIVVVDDASNDETARMALDRGAHVERVDVRHIAAARNTGARAAQGARLVFVDADTLVDAAVLRAAMHALDAGASGGGAAVALLGAITRSERVLVDVARRVFRRTGIAPGCFIFCTRAAFDAVGGFDETWYAGEDVAISRALARQGRFVILREGVRTSDRKLRRHGAMEHLRLLLRFALGGRRILRSRDALPLWYGPRRD